MLLEFPVSHLVMNRCQHLGLGYLIVAHFSKQDVFPHEFSSPLHLSHFCLRMSSSSSSTPDLWPVPRDVLGADGVYSHAVHPTVKEQGGGYFLSQMLWHLFPSVGCLFCKMFLFYCARTKCTNTSVWSNNCVQPSSCETPQQGWGPRKPHPCPQEKTFNHTDRKRSEPACTVQCWTTLACTTVCQEWSIQLAAGQHGPSFLSLESWCFWLFPATSFFFRAVRGSPTQAWLAILFAPVLTLFTLMDVTFFSSVVCLLHTQQGLFIYGFSRHPLLVHILRKTVLSCVSAPLFVVTSTTVFA